MAETKQQDGFIPAGLVVESLYGTMEGELKIAGEVEHVELQAGQLRIDEGGIMKDGQVEAGSITIDGHVSGVTFTTPRLTAGAGARISDCVIEMGSPTGCAIHEDASFEGDVRISVSRKGGKPGGRDSGGAAGKVDNSKADNGLAGNKAGRKTAENGDQPDNEAESASLVAHDDAPDPHWPARTPDISEADKDADIPLGG